MPTSQFAIAAHALAVLAHDGGSAPLEVLAESVNTPASFVESVLGSLVRARIVEARAGHGGGYTLARAANAITLAEVHDAMEPEGESIAVGGRAAVRAAVHELLGQLAPGSDPRTELARFTVADLARMAFGERQLPYFDARQFEAEVERASGKVLVDFTATWCGPCQKLAPVLEQLARDAKGAYRVVRVDIDDVPEVAQRHAIRGVPTVVAFVGGKPVARHVGLTDAATLLRLLDG